MYFKGDLHFLSNFYPAPFKWGGIVWPNAEAAYQASKCSNPADRLQFVAMTNPVQAKRMGRLIKCVDDWDSIKSDVMLSVVHAKFLDPSLRLMLVATGNEYLEEGNNHRDNYWGRCPPGNPNGHNMLGRILMNQRACAKDLTALTDIDITYSLDDFGLIEPKMCSNCMLIDAVYQNGICVQSTYNVEQQLSYVNIKVVKSSTRITGTVST